MDVAVGDIIVLNHDNRIAVRFEEGAQLGDRGVGILVDEELGAVAVLDILDLHQIIGEDAFAGGVAVELRLRGDFLACDDAAAVKYLLHTGEDEQDALAAGVNHASFFEHRQQVGGIVQRLLAGFHDLSPQGWHLGCGRGLSRFGRQAGDGQNRAFGRLHNRFVSRVNTHLEGVGQVFCFGGLLALQSLREAAEQKACDNAGVAPRPAQHRRSGSLAGLGHGAGIGHGLQLGHSRADRHAHIGAGVAIRHRENVQLIHAGALVRNIVGA